MDKHRNYNRLLAFLEPLKVVDGLQLDDMIGASGIIPGKANKKQLEKILDICPRTISLFDRVLTA
jgi:hypothetical protein